MGIRRLSATFNGPAHLESLDSPNTALSDRNKDSEARKTNGLA